MRCGASPGWYWRNCQKESPWPTRRRPCTPCATVAATRSAATSSGGSAAASCSPWCWIDPVAAAARAMPLTRLGFSHQGRGEALDDLRDGDAFGAGGEVERHAV